MCIEQLLRIETLPSNLSPEVLYQNLPDLFNIVLKSIQLWSWTLLLYANIFKISLLDVVTSSSSRMNLQSGFSHSSTLYHVQRVNFQPYYMNHIWTQIECSLKQETLHWRHLGSSKSGHDDGQSYDLDSEMKHLPLVNQMSAYQCLVCLSFPDFHVRFPCMYWRNLCFLHTHCCIH